MSIRGNIKDFNIAEIFQFLSLGHKTGVLKIKGKEEGYIYFRNGRGYFATSTKYRKPIGQRLAEAGLLKKEDLARALEGQKEKNSDKRIGRILLDMGLIEARALESFIKEQIWDAFLDILSWEEGEFNFETGKVPTEEDIGISFEAWEKVVTSIPSFESIIKSEHWAKIKEAIPSFDIVYTLDQKRAADVVGISLAPNEWGLVCLIDGKTSVQELITKYGKDTFQAGHTLYKLLKAGLIVQVEEKKTHVPTQAAAPVREVERKAGFGKEPREEAREARVPEPLVEKKAEFGKKPGEEIKEVRLAQLKVAPGSEQKPEREAGEEKKLFEEEKRPEAARSPEKATAEESEPPRDRAKDKQPVPTLAPKIDAGASGKVQEAKKESGEKPAEKEISLGPLEIKALGNLEVWVGKEKRFADLFIIRKGEKASNVLRFPDGKYQFVHDRFSPEEKKAIVEKISAGKK